MRDGVTIDRVCSSAVQRMENVEACYQGVEYCVSQSDSNLSHLCIGMDFIGTRNIFQIQNIKVKYYVRVYFAMLTSIEKFAL